MTGLGLGLGSGLSGGARPTPAPSVGNLVLATSWADFLTKYAAAVVGDVVSINHGGYTPTTPQTFTPTRALGAGGITLIGASNQVIALVIDGITAMNTEFVNWYCDIDSVNGNETSSGIAASSIFCRNSSNFAIRGCVATRGAQTIYNYNCSNFVEENNVAQFSRADALRLDINPAQFQIKGSYLADVATNNIMWWYADGTTPTFGATDPGGGATSYPKEHNDGIQAFLGSMTDGEISNNDILIYGQGIFIADNVGNPQLRVKISGNNIKGADPYQLLVDNGSHVEVTGNAFSAFSPWNPDASDAKITIAGSNIKVGLNTVSYGATPVTYVGTTGAAFTGAISGTATAPTAPTWTGTTSNVGSLVTLRQRKTPASVPSPAAPVGLPILLSDGTNIIGTKVTARPPLWNPYTPGMEDNLYSRFKLDGTIVRASTQGRAAMVYTTLAAGALTVQFSSDNVTWSTASAAMTISSGTGAAWDPAHKDASVTLSSGNTIATAVGGPIAGRFSAYGTTAKSADGKYAVRLTPTSWTQNAEGVGFARAALATNIEIGGAANTWGMYPDGTIQKAGVFAGSLGARTQTAYDYHLEISSSGTVAKLWIYDVNAAAWLSSFGGGDPNGGGGGWDISSFLGAGGITFAWNGSRDLNESCTVATTGFTPASGFSVWG